MNKFSKSTARKAASRFVPRFFTLEDRVVPANLFVDPAFASLAKGTPATFNGTPAAAVTVGQDGFGTLFEALQKAAATDGSDVITLANGKIAISNQNGSPVTDGTIGISSAVDIVGQGAAKTTIVPLASTKADTPLLGVAGSSPVTVNFSNFTVDGSGFNVGAALGYFDNASGTVSGVTLANIKDVPNAGGVGVIATNSLAVTVTKSTITGYGRAGVSFDNSPAAGNANAGNSASGVTASTITGPGTGPGSGISYGIQVFDGSVVTLTGNKISNNTGSLAKDADNTINSAAVYIDSTSTAAKATVFANELKNNSVGILVGSGGTGDTAFDQSKVSLTGNNYYNDSTTGSFDFTPDNLKPVSQFDYFLDSGDSSGTVTYTSKSLVPNQLTKADGTPFSSISEFLLATKPSLFKFAVGAGAGDSSSVITVDNQGTASAPTNPIGTGTNGARVAYGDVNGDGFGDTIVASGPGVAPRVVILSGDGGSTLADFAPFEATFKGGVFVSVGDINNDGKADLVVTPDVGGSQRVVVYSGAGFSAGSNSPVVLANYFGLASLEGTFDDPGFRGGVRAAVGDVNGDGFPDILIAAGEGGGPRITVWNGVNVAKANAGTPSGTGVVLANFFAFELSLRNGANVAAGDLNGDGKADMIFGGGPGGAPRVRVADAAAVITGGNFVSLDNKPAYTLSNFFAGDTTLRGGIRVLGRDLDGDGKTEIITGSGETTAANVRVYKTATVLASTAPQPDITFNPFSGAVLAGGVYVG